MGPLEAYPEGSPSLGRSRKIY
ncbi:unnamed protein product [Acanthoscelides obtectus]|uniref:Uncharacterized protein n=1 Tax=Acanthoscelides obtectus TaxID=200917 RepID=A0A9P0PH94_ACAOB|nr:unnamed protein product [Acanthoscelides obtectus]CAK1620499.1 hypothetical protein AOBTE_LOCUS408 [Acanthoscelides obtectus]